MLDCSMAPPATTAGAHRCTTAMNSTSPYEASVNATTNKDVAENVFCRDNTLFVIDWDDTLLASSWLAAQGLRLDSEEIPPAVRAQLAQLEQRITTVLNRVLQLGKVAIVTNAERGWVELSARKFVPSVAALLPQMRVMSARSSFQDQFPSQLERWKIEAYRQVFAEAFANNNDSAFNVLSFGDSMYERTALLSLASRMPNAVPKSVKFVERPSMEQLQRQLEILYTNLESVLTCPSSIDLMLTIEYLCE